MVIFLGFLGFFGEVTFEAEFLFDFYFEILVLIFCGYDSDLCSFDVLG